MRPAASGHVAGRGDVSRAKSRTNRTTSGRAGKGRSLRKRKSGTVRTGQKRR
jgi:hypothetical protein